MFQKKNINIEMIDFKKRRRDITNYRYYYTPIWCSAIIQFITLIHYFHSNQRNMGMCYHSLTDKYNIGTMRKSKVSFFSAYLHPVLDVTSPISFHFERLIVFCCMSLLSILSGLFM